MELLIENWNGKINYDWNGREFPLSSRVEFKIQDLSKKWKQAKILGVITLEGI
jgi:hypothetical protein